MSKTSVFTTITPLPAGITRQSVIDMYHAHNEMIDLNPLVIDRFKCKAPGYAPAEEHHSTWYTIKDKVSYLPGGLASSSVSYHACFHDLADGLQTHVYAPLGLDIRAKWSVGGSLPGEPKEPVELGLGAPREGIYIREDVRMRCNIMMISFVKKTFKESHAKMVDKLVEKAHEVESRQANERLNQLKNVAPGERMGHGSIFIAPPPGYTGDVRNVDKPLPELRESIHSDGSIHSQTLSERLSQASNMTSQSDQALKSPQQYQRQYQQQQQYQHQHQHQRPYSVLEPPKDPTMSFSPGPGHSHSRSQSHGSRGNPQSGIDRQQLLGQQQQQQQQQTQTLSNLSYLPSTVYNPYTNSNRDAQQHPVYQSHGRSFDPLLPPPVELPAHMQDSPTLPPASSKEREKHIAELPA